MSCHLNMTQFFRHLPPKQQFQPLECWNKSAFLLQKTWKLPSQSVPLYYSQAAVGDNWDKKNTPRKMGTKLQLQHRKTAKYVQVFQGLEVMESQFITSMNFGLCEFGKKFASLI